MVTERLRARRWRKEQKRRAVRRAKARNGRASWSERHKKPAPPPPAIKPGIEQTIPVKGKLHRLWKKFIGGE